MTEMVVTDEQAKIIFGSEGSVAVRNPNGELLGFISPGYSATDIKEVEEARRRMASDQPVYTTKEVLAHLHSLGQQ